MKFYKPFLILIVISLFSCSNYNGNDNKKIVSNSNNNLNEKLIGEWNAMNNTSLIFDKNGDATFELKGSIVMSSADYNGKKLECKYEIDTSKDPIWLDIVCYPKGQHELAEGLKGIVKFITDNKIEVRFSHGDDAHYEYFDPSDTGHTFVFDRVKN